MSKKQKNKNSNKIVIVLIILLAILLMGGLFLGIYLMEKSDGSITSENVSGGSGSGADTPNAGQGGQAVLDDSLYYENVQDDNVRKDAGSALEYADNQLLITVTAGTQKEQVEAIIAPYQAKIVGYIDATNIYQIQFEKGYSKTELEEIGEELEKNPEISDSSINAVFNTDISAVYPDDTKWKNEWGDAYPKGNNWGMEAIHAPEAWDYKDSLSSVNVGIYDNVFVDHEDLQFEKVWLNANPDDVEHNFHGNHVSGTISAGFDNGRGVCGVAPNAKLYGTSFESAESKYDTSTMALMAAFTYLIHQEKCKVINLSIGWDKLTIAASENDQDAKDVIEDQAEILGNYLQKLLDISSSNDFIICKAAGNENDDEDHPVYADDLICSIQNPDIRDRIIVVGAAKNLKNGNYQIADFSNCGERVDVVAPGVDIYSTGLPNKYPKKKGTSMATPHVSGIAALCFGANPSLSGAQVKEIIQDTAQGEIRYRDMKKKSYDELENYSYPMVDAERAVERALETEGNYQDYSDYQESGEYILDSQQAERDVVLVLDQSGSMNGQPLEETKKAATSFSDTVLEEDTRAAVVAYDDDASLYCGLTRESSVLDMNISTIFSNGSTNMYAGLQMADEILKQSQAKKKIIVLMSDGLPNRGMSDSTGYEGPLLSYAETLKNQGYYIYTLGFFENVDSYELSGAQQLMEGIASPGLHYEVTSADELVFFFDDIAGQINGTEYVYIRIACPVDVTVSNGGETLSTVVGSDGNMSTRTSFGTLTFDSLTEEEMASEGIDDLMSEEGTDDYTKNLMAEQAKVLRLKADQNYDVNIEGYDSGTMNYSVKYQNENGEYDDVRQFTNIPVTSSMKASSNTEKSDASYLEIDEDGDGKTDKKYKAEKNGTMEEVKNHTLLYICIGVGVLLVIIVVIVIIVLVRRAGKKKKRTVQHHVKSYEPVVSGAVVGEFGKFGGQSYPMFSNRPCVVGRKSSCDIQIVHKQVSRVHCSIRLMSDGRYQVTDYSGNGTYYNNQLLPKNKPCILPKGSLLAIGDADNILRLR
ncbi:MAG: S8 family serine peptidase [Lachnospiraceae bacterium]